MNWARRRKQGDPVAMAELASVESALTQEVLVRTDATRTSAEPGMTPGQGSRPVTTLPKHTALLRYFLRADSVDAVLQKGSQLQRWKLPIQQAELNRAVQALRSVLANPDANPLPAAQALHRLLLAPVQSQLRGIRHLVLAPDAALRYVPFAALHDGRHFLMQSLALSVELAGVAAPKPSTRGRRGQRLAAFGRGQPDAQHGALPAVPQELMHLGHLRVAQTPPALDAAFTGLALQQALAQSPSVVHLASHFVLDPAGEEQSYLLLGDGRRMSLRELRNLPWAGVDLAVLSACDSGLALDVGSGSGREVSGFAQTLNAAGVRNVLATLWRVDDAATAQWVQFYQPWQRAGRLQPLTPAHLAATQRQWLRQHAGTRWGHPHYWAAFSWMGASI